jgi:hypothetical protein
MNAAAVMLAAMVCFRALLHFMGASGLSGWEVEVVRDQSVSVSAIGPITRKLKQLNFASGLLGQ